jgi:hypothetical protein
MAHSSEGAPPGVGSHGCLMRSWGSVGAPGQQVACGACRGLELQPRTGV